MCYTLYHVGGSFGLSTERWWGPGAVREGACRLTPGSDLGPPGPVWFGSECDCHVRDHKEPTTARTTSTHWSKAAFTQIYTCAKSFQLGREGGVIETGSALLQVHKSTHLHRRRLLSERGPTDG